MNDTIKTNLSTFLTEQNFLHPRTRPKKNKDMQFLNHYSCNETPKQIPTDLSHTVRKKTLLQKITYFHILLKLLLFSTNPIIIYTDVCFVLLNNNLDNNINLSKATVYCALD